MGMGRSLPPACGSTEVQRSDCEPGAPVPRARGGEVMAAAGPRVLSQPGEREGAAEADGVALSSPAELKGPLPILLGLGQAPQAGRGLGARLVDVAQALPDGRIALVLLKHFLQGRDGLCLPG